MPEIIHNYDAGQKVHHTPSEIREALNASPSKRENIFPDSQEVPYRDSTSKNYLGVGVLIFGLLLVGMFAYTSCSAGKRVFNSHASHLEEVLESSR